MQENSNDNALTERLLRRDEAARFLTEDVGFPMTKGRLAKLAVSGESPPFRYAGAKYVVYEPSELRRWAAGQLSKPVRSAAEGAALKSAQAA
jgi:hypothetical protein